MEENLPDITLKPIGIVRSDIKERTRYRVKNNHSQIEININLSEGLDNLDEFSHIIVIYYIHQSHKPAPLKVHPRKRIDREPVGVFASRSPDRPNPIGKSIVKLVHRKDNVLTVEGLDAMDGSPVLDIKPYVPGLDSVDNARVARWMTDH
jgi:tRNA-Thr(GGU) m(6)t(6)A37 methyltransferase TsaA